MLATSHGILTSSGGLDTHLNSGRTMLDRIIDLPVFIVKAISILTIESVLGENMDQ